MTQTEALRLAFEALHYCEALNSSVEKQKMQAITAIKAALEAKYEPAAWMYPDDLKRFETSEAYAEAYSIEMVSPTQGETVPLYTTPPQRKPLTDEEIWKFWWNKPEVPEGEDDSMEAQFVAACRRAIEAAHGIKE